MTWQSAQAAARERVNFLLARGIPPGSRIRLALFENADTYFFLKGANEWPFGFHCMVVRACAREFRKRGFKVELITLELAQYYDFLDAEKIKDSPSARAQFISLAAG